MAFFDRPTIIVHLNDLDWRVTGLTSLRHTPLDEHDERAGVVRYVPEVTWITDRLPEDEVNVLAAFPWQAGKSYVVVAHVLTEPFINKNYGPLYEAGWVISGNWKYPLGACLGWMPIPTEGPTWSSDTPMPFEAFK